VALERVELRFSVTGPRATGLCTLKTTLTPSVVLASDILFDSLEARGTPCRSWG
jgi:hypothetical protein